MKPISPQPSPTIDEAFLYAMCQQAASLTEEDLPWDEIEKGVFSELDDELLHQHSNIQRQASHKQQSKRVKARWPWLVVTPLATAAAVAGVALIVGESGTKSTSTMIAQTERQNIVRTEPVAKPPAPALSTASGAVAVASTIASNDTIDPDDSYINAIANQAVLTTDHAVTVKHQGWTAFRLTPDSEVQIKQADNRVELELLRGKIDTIVKLPSKSHAFVVHVDSLKLSVLGTVFSVDRTRSNQLRVQVQKGSVSVAQTLAGAPARTISIVSAGSAKVFSLPAGQLLSEQNRDLAPIDIHLPPATQNSSVSAANENDSHNSPKYKSTQNISESSKLDDTPQGPLTTEQIQPVLESISRQVQACHRTHVPHDTNLTIRASTTIWIQIAPDGHVTYARFVPPLIPSAQTCASRVVQTAKFPKSSSDFSWHWTVNIDNTPAD